MPADTSATPPFGDQRDDTVKLVGQFRIIKQIGHGASGIVYQARDLAIGRDVAIKELSLSRLSPGEIPEARQRFIREAQAVGNLRHENIVTLYQFMEQRDSLYLVMEYVPAGSLRPELIGTCAEALGVVRQVAAALDHAHSSGIIHRDIKPGNILVSSNSVSRLPVMKIADFGIARFLTQTMTMTGVSFGTPAYMAPEQIMGSRVDARADQFSLGVLAFELLSRKLPFAGSSHQALMFQIVNGEPASLLEANPGLPAEVEVVVGRALAKNPDQRFASCGEFGEALERALLPPSLRTVRTARTVRTEAKTGASHGTAKISKRLLAFVCLLPVIVLALCLRWLGSRSTDAPTTRPQLVGGVSANKVSEGVLTDKGHSESRTAETATELPSGAKAADYPAHSVSDVSVRFKDDIWRTVQDWNSSILSGDVERYRNCYADRLARFYNHANAPVSETMQLIVDEMRKYPVREITVSNASFQVVSSGVQVDFDKAYRFSGPGVRLNQGEVKESLRLAQDEAGKWKITAEFDREICWSTQMRDPALQVPPGTCR